MLIYFYYYTYNTIYLYMYTYTFFKKFKSIYFIYTDNKYYFIGLGHYTTLGSPEEQNKCDFKNLFLNMMQGQCNKVGNLEQQKELKCELIRTKFSKQCLRYFGAEPVSY